MKHIFLGGTLALAVVLAGATAYAQAGGQAGSDMRGPHQPMSADQRLQRMTQQLSLTTDQQSQIKPILENESQQMDSLRSDTSLSQPDRMSKMQAIHENTNSQIKPILTADQQAKWQQMMEHRGHRSGMPQGNAGVPAQSPQ